MIDINKILDFVVISLVIIFHSDWLFIFFHIYCISGRPHLPKVPGNKEGIIFIHFLHITILGGYLRGDNHF